MLKIWWKYFSITFLSTVFFCLTAPLHAPLSHSSIDTTSYEQPECELIFKILKPDMVSGMLYVKDNRSESLIDTQSQFNVSAKGLKIKGQNETKPEPAYEVEDENTKFVTSQDAKSSCMKLKRNQYMVFQNNKYVAMISPDATIDENKQETVDTNVSCNLSHIDVLTDSNDTFVLIATEKSLRVIYPQIDKASDTRSEDTSIVLSLNPKSDFVVMVTNLEVTVNQCGCLEVYIVKVETDTVGCSDMPQHLAGSDCSPASRVFVPALKSKFHRFGIYGYNSTENAPSLKQSDKGCPDTSNVFEPNSPTVMTSREVTESDKFAVQETGYIVTPQNMPNTVIDAISAELYQTTVANSITCVLSTANETSQHRMIQNNSSSITVTDGTGDEITETDDQVQDFTISSSDEKFLGQPTDVASGKYTSSETLPFEVTEGVTKFSTAQVAVGGHENGLGIAEISKMSCDQCATDFSVRSSHDGPSTDMLHEISPRHEQEVDNFDVDFSKTENFADISLTRANKFSTRSSGGDVSIGLTLAQGPEITSDTSDFPTVETEVASNSSLSEKLETTLSGDENNKTTVAYVVSPVIYSSPFPMLDSVHSTLKTEDKGTPGLGDPNVEAVLGQIKNITQNQKFVTSSTYSILKSVSLEEEILDTDQADYAELPADTNVKKQDNPPGQNKDDDGSKNQIKSATTDSRPTYRLSSPCKSGLVGENLCKTESDIDEKDYESYEDIVLRMLKADSVVTFPLRNPDDALPKTAGTSVSAVPGQIENKDLVLRILKSRTSVTAAAESSERSDPRFAKLRSLIESTTTNYIATKAQENGAYDTDYGDISFNDLYEYDGNIPDDYSSVPDYPTNFGVPFPPSPTENTTESANIRGVDDTPLHIMLNSVIQSEGQEKSTVVHTTSLPILETSEASKTKNLWSNDTSTEPVTVSSVGSNDTECRTNETSSAKITEDGITGNTTVPLSFRQKGSPNVERYDVLDLGPSTENRISVSTTNRDTSSTTSGFVDDTRQEREQKADLETEVQKTELTREVLENSTTPIIPRYFAGNETVEKPADKFGSGTNASTNSVLEIDEATVPEEYIPAEQAKRAGQRDGTSEGGSIIDIRDPLVEITGKTEVASILDIAATDGTGQVETTVNVRDTTVEQPVLPNVTTEVTEANRTVGATTGTYESKTNTTYFKTEKAITSDADRIISEESEVQKIIVNSSFQGTIESTLQSGGLEESVRRPAINNLRSRQEIDFKGNSEPKTKEGNVLGTGNDFESESSPFDVSKSPHTEPEIIRSNFTTQNSVLQGSGPHIEQSLKLGTLRQGNRSEDINKRDSRGPGLGLYPRIGPEHYTTSRLLVGTEEPQKYSRSHSNSVIGVAETTEKPEDKNNKSVGINLSEFQTPEAKNGSYSYTVTEKLYLASKVVHILLVITFLTAFR